MMIDYEDENKLVEDNYRFLFYFDAESCIPNMGAHGEKNLFSDNRYFMTASCTKHKIRKYLQYIGNEDEILHVDLPDCEDTVIEKRLFKDEKASKYSPEEQFEKELEYKDIRMFHTLDVGGLMKAKAKGSGPISICTPKTVDPVQIKEMYGTRSYSISVDENGKNNGSNYGNPSWMIEYGLFKVRGGVNLSEVKRHRLTEKDLDDFFEGLWGMFDMDSSCFRPMGSMCARKLVIWKYSKNTGISNHNLAQLIENTELYKKKSGIIIPRNLDDYELQDLKPIEGVTTYLR